MAILLDKKYDENTRHFVYRVAGIRISKKDKIGILKSENEYLRSVINSIGADKIPAATGELRDWQLDTLDVLKNFDRICQENNLSYWLDFGTLLGAVRHRGFIPWDDDLDVSMLVSDIKKLIPILEKELASSDFYIRESADTDSKFQIRIRHKDYNMGLDIFSMIPYSQENLTDELKNDIRDKIIRERKNFEHKFNSLKPTKNTISKAKIAIDEFNNNLCSNNTQIPQNPILCRGIEFGYEEDYYVMPYDEIFPLKQIDFENQKFYVPNKYIEYLSHLYGDWNKIPSGAGGVYLHYKKNYKQLYKENS